MSKFFTGLGLLMSACLLPAAAAQDAELHPEQSRQEQRFAGVFPPGVRTIACITPASYPGSSSHRRCPKLLKKAGYKVKVFPHSFDKPQPGKRYAPLEGRLEDFYAAWNDPEVDFILCFRGGGGSQGLVTALDLKKLKKRDNLYLQGYSDVTHVISWMLAKGYGRPVAGPMCGSLVGITPECLREMKAMHHGEQVGPVPVKKMIGGDASGLAYAGSLGRMSEIAQSDYRPSMAGRIVFIESVGTPTEKIRSFLQILVDREFCKGASAVVYGQFIRCGEKAEVDAVLEEFAPKFGVPVYRDFPFGHSPQCYTLDFSRRAEIRNNTITFPAVEASGK